MIKKNIITCTFNFLNFVLFLFPIDMIKVIKPTMGLPSALVGWIGMVWYKKSTVIKFH